jgi:hypothetical protein
MNNQQKYAITHPLARASGDFQRKRPKRSRLPVKCKGCSKCFLAIPSQVDNGNGKYCSKDCWLRARRPEQVGRICCRCKLYKLAGDFGIDKQSLRLRSYCAKCRAIQSFEARQKKVETLNVKSLGLTIVMARFGLSHLDYDRILTEQSGRCSICRSVDPGKGHNRFLVDHDHITGAMRGLLCTYCNTAIGMFRERTDIMQAAIAYIECHRRTMLTANSSGE